MKRLEAVLRSGWRKQFQLFLFLFAGVFGVVGFLCGATNNPILMQLLSGMLAFGCVVVMVVMLVMGLDNGD